MLLIYAMWFFLLDCYINDLYYSIERETYNGTRQLSPSECE